MPEDRRKNQCPECESQMLYREGEKVRCANTKCFWEGIEAKREEDKKLSTLPEIRNAWGLG